MLGKAVATIAAEQSKNRPQKQPVADDSAVTLLDRLTVDTDKNFTCLGVLECNVALKTDGYGAVRCRLFALCHQLATDIIDTGVEDYSVFGDVLQCHLNTDAVAIKEGAAN